MYLGTLSHWLTLSSLPVAAEISGWRWQVMVEQPVLFLLTWPLRWLPATWTPLGLNVFAAGCASLTLALLARSVALLPQDRLEQQRVVVRHEKGLLSGPSAWVPPLLAAVVLGLQLTFWENATAGSGEMVELLLFAGVIWCILEHRCDPRLCWLDRASFICGAALANSWAMAGFVPLVAVALICSKRLSFFNVRFLERVENSTWKRVMPALAEDGRFFLRMILFWLAGLSLVLLLPLVNGLSPDSPLSFWQALRAIAGAYASNVLSLVTKVFRYHKEATLLLVAVSLVPALVLSIRWGASAGSESTRRLDPVSLILYAAHAFLLLLCVSVAFDPPFSPRQLSPRLGIMLAFLPLYYLGALSVGYYSGFFLMIFSRYPGTRRRLPQVLHWTAPIIVYALLGLTLAGLLWKNLPTIRVANGRQLDDYARFIMDSLPPEGAVVCSYDPARSALLSAALGREGKAKRYVEVDANALPSERYRAWLKRRYPKQWTEPPVAPKPGAPGNPTPPASEPLNPQNFLRLMHWIAQSNRLCYLQPSSGLLTEKLFYPQPRGLVYELKRYPTNAFNAPPPTGPELAENEAFWKRVSETSVNPLARLISEAEQPPTGVAGYLMQWAHITRPPPVAMRLLAHWYSGALNGWGVVLQRRERWEEATPCFAKAIELNADNLPAQVNLYCNSNRLASRQLTLSLPYSIREQFGKVRNVDQILVTDGPFDEPTCCYELGMVYKNQNLPRQAGQQLERAQALAPKEIYVRLSLGNLLNGCGMPDRAMQMAEEIRADPSLQPLDPKVDVDLAFLEAEAWFVKTNRAKAVGILQSLLDSHPGDSAVLGRLAVAFTVTGSYTNALRIVEQQLQRTPDSIPTLMDKGLLYFLAGEFSNAVPTFTHVLSLTNSYPALFNRAMAYLQTTQWDRAVDDYKDMIRRFPDACQPYYGLAEVALKQGNTNAAIQYYQQYLSKAPTNHNQAEFRMVSARLKAVQPRTP
jgi:tetratricopeptide (TPR) repeat protein